MNTIPSDVQSRISDLIKEVPVDVSKIAERLGLAVYVSALADGVSGVLVRDEAYGTPTGFVILVDDSESYSRQRFTAAHEIGHFVLHKDKIGIRVEDNYLLRSNVTSNWMEREANKFAAELLMPIESINKLIGEGIKDVKAMANSFNVSEIAMAIRLGHPT